MTTHRMREKTRPAWQAASLLAMGVLAAAGACSSGGAKPDAGSATDTSSQPDEGPSDGGGSVVFDSFVSPADPGAGALWFAASGELLALSGYPFPPVNDGAPAFVDGWAVQFKHLLVTLDKIRVSSNPDVSPGDQSLTGPAPGSPGGGLVAEVDGPWAVDLAATNAASLDGNGDPGVKAQPLAVLKSQNKNGNAPFATDGTRYGVGFDIARATSPVFNVNLDPDAQADYALMVQQQCTVLYVGTATFNGSASCNVGREAWPRTVAFQLCFKSPTTYRNCQNGSDDTATPLPGEEHQRGLALSTSRSVLAQITVHTDHPFWDSVLHDSPAHFDQFAARVVGQSDAGVPTVTLDMTQGVDFTAYTDALGNLLDWRYCLDPDITVHPRLTGVMAFDRQSVPRAAGGDGSSGLRDYDDFATYNQSTQGHLNADGLCAVEHNYPSPN
jgi:hypothetical protein